MTLEPRFLLSLGLFLLLVGFALPVLMVLRLVESTFTLNFLAWGASVSGLFLGFIGAANLAKFNKK
jgi:hypothetical protein